MSQIDFFEYSKKVRSVSEFWLSDHIINSIFSDFIKRNNVALHIGINIEEFD